MINVSLIMKTFQGNAWYCPSAHVVPSRRVHFCRVVGVGHVGIYNRSLTLYETQDITSIMWYLAMKH